MKKIKSLFLLWLPVFFWAGLIFYFSSIPNLKTISNPRWDEIIRSLLHLAMFFIFYCLTFRALNFQKLQKSYFTPWLICAVYAVSDELHQYFVPTRTFQLKDLLIDFLGSGLGIWGVFYLILWTPGKIKILLEKLGYR